MDGRGIGVQFQMGEEISLFSAIPKQALSSKDPLIQSLTGDNPPEIKQPERETDHSPLYSVQIKNMLRYTSPPPYFFMASCSI
jgi:hypothetical protein